MTKPGYYRALVAGLENEPAYAFDPASSPLDDHELRRIKPHDVIIYHDHPSENSPLRRPLIEARRKPDLPFRLTRNHGTLTIRTGILLRSDTVSPTDHVGHEPAKKAWDNRLAFNHVIKLTDKNFTERPWHSRHPSQEHMGRKKAMPAYPSIDYLAKTPRPSGLDVKRKRFKDSHHF